MQFKYKEFLHFSQKIFSNQHSICNTHLLKHDTTQGSPQVEQEYNW